MGGRLCSHFVCGTAAIVAANFGVAFRWVGVELGLPFSGGLAFSFGALTGHLKAVVILKLARDAASLSTFS